MLEPKYLLQELKVLEERWLAVIKSGAVPSLALMLLTVKHIKDVQKLLHIVESGSQNLEELPDGVVRLRRD